MYLTLLKHTSISSFSKTYNFITKWKYLEHGLESSTCMMCIIFDCGLDAAGTSMIAPIRVDVVVHTCVSVCVFACDCV